MNSIPRQFCEHPIGFHIARHCKFSYASFITDYAIKNNDYYLIHGLLDNCLKKYVKNEISCHTVYNLTSILIEKNQFPRYLQNLIGPNWYRSRIVDILGKHKLQPVPWTSNLYEKSVKELRTHLVNNKNIIINSKYFEESPKSLSPKLRIRNAQQLLIKDKVFDVNVYYRYYCSCIPSGHFRDIITFYFNHLMSSDIKMEDLKDSSSIIEHLNYMKEHCNTLILSENDAAFHIISWCTIIGCLNKRVLSRPTNEYIFAIFICMSAIQSLLNNGSKLHHTTLLHCLGYFFVLDKVQMFSSRTIRFTHRHTLGIPLSEIYSRYQQYYSTIQANIPKIKDYKLMSMTMRFVDLQFDSLDYNYKLSRFKVGLPHIGLSEMVEICKNIEDEEIFFYIRCIIGHGKSVNSLEYIKSNINALILNEILSPETAWYYVLNHLSYFPSNGIFLRELYEYVVRKHPNDDIIVGTSTFLYLRGLCHIEIRIVVNWMKDYIDDAPFNDARLVAVLNKMKLKSFKSSLEFNKFLDSLPLPEQKKKDFSSKIIMKPSDKKKKRRSIKV
eukprot:NODE_300_length_11422_cov_0.297978.p1 type:complete len:554 gc:universal NODE_300_length_11422_cov_0.297978:5629-7290(+)